MKKQITLTNEESISLYNFFSRVKLEKGKNRIRWKFLAVIEEGVFAFEDAREKMKDALTQSQQEMTDVQTDPKLTMEQKSAKRTEAVQFSQQKQEELKNLRKASHDYLFNDRELFIEATKLFDDVTGKEDELVDQDGKLYKQIQDAILYAKEVGDNTAQAKPAAPANEATKGDN